MADCCDELIDRFALTSAEFEEKLRQVRPDQWTASTPCSEWDVRDLVNHMTRGNLNYVLLVEGGTGAEFLRSRDVDAPGADPVAAYARSVRDCAAAFAAPGALQRILDYPLGRVTGRQALAIFFGVDQLFQAGLHPHFVRAGAIDRARQRDQPGAARFSRADFGKPLGAFFKQRGRRLGVR